MQDYDCVRRTAGAEFRLKYLLQEFLRHAHKFLEILKEEDSEEESEEDDDDDDDEEESDSDDE